MKWTDAHDKYLLRELLIIEPWLFKKSTTERGDAWEKLDNSLNASSSLLFRVSQRSVRDRYMLIEKKFKKKESG